MGSVAQTLSPFLNQMLGADLPVRILCWDGSSLGPPDSAATILLRSPDALRRIAFAPNELGLGRAYVAGDVDIEGDIFQVLALRERIAPHTSQTDLKMDFRLWARLLRAAHSLGVIGRPLPPPAEEARLRGRRHSKQRDAAAISHHYDISNDFYRFVLGDTMTYSCAYFPHEEMSLDDAQRAKYELICRKLQLDRGMRLLDVGCGWGGMVIHAAQHHDVSAVGITLSQKQADLAAKRVADAGLAERVEIRLQDYRDVDDGPFDAISSIGMFEHVGLARLGQYFEGLFGLLRPRGRLLNHGIAHPPGRPGFSKRSFIARYVFPDGELHDLATVTAGMEQQGFEVRDVESLREHYALTLRAWVANLEANWDEAVELVGQARSRIWRLYMSGAAVNFEAGRTTVYQLLGVKATPEGKSGMPRSRDVLLGRGA